MYVAAKLKTVVSKSECFDIVFMDYLWPVVLPAS